MHLNFKYQNTRFKGFIWRPILEGDKVLRFIVQGVDTSMLGPN